VPATSSSRFTAPAYWLDKTTGTAYIVQVQYPEYRMNSTAQLEAVPVSSAAGDMHLLGEVASWKRISIPAEYDRLNQQRYITITANVQGEDPGSVFKKVNRIISNTTLPKGSRLLLRGQPELLTQTLGSLQFGLLIAIVVIFLLMTVFFQSFRVAAIALSVIPAVIAGALFLLFITGNTMNIQSYMGAIMAIGVAIANVVLFVTNANRDVAPEMLLQQLISALRKAACVLSMTSLAMIAGMTPMALGMGEGATKRRHSV